MINCEFVRDGERVVCKWCGFSLRTKADETKLKADCINKERTHELPGWREMASNLLSSLWKAAKDGFQTSEDEEVNRRISICNQCEFFRKEQNQCEKCGCYLSLKTRLESSNCPIGKW